MLNIKQINITKLFGLFDHTIPLNLNENVTIIHGPNGMGKTIMLKMIDSLAQNTYDIFYRVPFELFQITFDNGSFVSIRHAALKGVSPLHKSTPNNDKKTVGPIELLCSYRLTPGKINNFYIRQRQNPADEMKDIAYFIESLTEKLGGLSFRANTSTNTGSFFKGKNEYTVYNVIEEYGDKLTIADKQQLIFHMSQTPSDYLELLENMMVHLISTQRLVTMKDKTETGVQIPEELQSSGTSSIWMFSKELSEKMSLKNNEYASLSQELDSTFPNRVIAQSISGASARSYEDLRIELINLEDKRTRLREVGLLDQGKVELLQEIPSEARLDYVAGVFEIYLKDAQAKLSVFEELADQIRLLINIINERFMFKKFKVDRRRGFIIELNNGSELSPTYLSSGEQHEVILAYELLFNVKPKSLVIIDEPEISLHIAWQIAFLKDIISIAKLRDFNVLIATHSPSIVGGRWDLTIDLAEREVEEEYEENTSPSASEWNDVYEPYSEEDDNLGDENDS